MAQQRLRNYKSGLLSYIHNLINLGVHKPGRFAGFDNAVATAALTFQIQHDADGTGLKVRSDSGDVLGPLGIAMTTQGVMIVEDAPLTGFVLDTNAGNGNSRIDLLVMNHQFQNIAGGSPATYSIIKGSTSDGTPGALSTPDYQVIIGRFILAPGATDSTLITWVKERAPDSGDELDARLNYVNPYTKQNQNASDPVVYTVPTDTFSSLGCWALSNKGNTYSLLPNTPKNIAAIKILDTEPAIGCEINLITNDQASLISLFGTMPAAVVDAGYVRISFNRYMGTGLTSLGLLGPQSMIQPPTGQRLIFKLLKTNKGWEVISVNTPGAVNTGIKPYMVLECDIPYGNVADYFATDGLGIGAYDGFQACNGLRGTQDRRGRVSMMTGIGIPIFDGVPVSTIITQANSLGFTMTYQSVDGRVSKNITLEEMPPHVHRIPASLNSGLGGAGAVPGTGVNGDEGGGNTDSTGGAGNPPVQKELDRYQPYICSIFIMKLP